MTQSRGSSSTFVAVMTPEQYFDHDRKDGSCSQLALAIVRDAHRAGNEKILVVLTPAPPEERMN